MVFITLVQVYCMLFPLQTSGSYLLTVGQDLAGLFEAVFAALRIRLPLTSLWVHVQELAATEHGNLWLRHLGAWPVHLSHGQSLGRKGGEGGRRYRDKRGEEESIQTQWQITLCLKPIQDGYTTDNECT